MKYETARDRAGRGTPANPAEEPAKPDPPDAVRRFCERYRRARANFDRVAPLLSEAYEFCLPLREGPYPDGGEGRQRLERVFDSTGQEALQSLASKMLDDGWPTDQKPFELRSGYEVPEEEREEVDRRAAMVANLAIDLVNASNYRAAGHEADQDWCIGTGVLLCERGDAVQPLRFRHVPLSKAVMDLGPGDERDALFFERKIRIGDIVHTWPGADLGPFRDRAEGAADDRVSIVEGWQRDWEDRGTERWTYRCVALDEMHTFKAGFEQGDGSRPFIDYDYSRRGGEVYGRGPAWIALPTIRVLNVVQEMLLEYADLAIGGVWQIEDNGIINPNTVRIQSGMILPVMPNSRGLQPVPLPGSPQLGQFVVADLQRAIRSMFMELDLGPTDQTPRTAEEVLQRTAERSAKRAGPYHRYLVEKIARMVKRVLFIAKGLGLIRLDAPVDGRTLRIRAVSPITRTQNLDDVLRHLRFVQMMRSAVAPQVASLLIDEEKLSSYLAERMGVDPNVLRSAVEKKRLAAAIAQLAATLPAQEEAPPRPLAA